MPGRAGCRHMNSGSVPAAAPCPALLTAPAAPSAPLLRLLGTDLGTLTRMASDRDSANPHVSLARGNIHGRGEPRFGGNIHCFYHLLLSFGNKFPLKTQFCFFPLLPFEEKAVAGCLLCSAKSSYETFSKKIRVRRGILLKRDAF